MPAQADSHDAHGTPLGADEAEATRKQLGWNYGEFEVPDQVYDTFRKHAKAGSEKQAAWNKMWKEYQEKEPELAAQFQRAVMDRKLPDNWTDALPKNPKQDCLNAIANVLPEFMGGSADLAPSNMTLMKCTGDFLKDSYSERNMRFGIREFGMGAVSNALSLDKTGIIPYCATFTIFTDYMRGAIRIAALSQAGTIFVTTHDSIAVGEDGPTHQPIETIPSLRLIPDLTVMRPADGNETAGAYKSFGLKVEERQQGHRSCLFDLVADAFVGIDVFGASAPGGTCAFGMRGDGCMQEGISHEACAYAGHLGLGKLIAFYDDNGITIDGHTDLSFTEDVGKRFEAYGWQVLEVSEGNTDVDAIRKAIKEAKACTDKPTLIKVKTTIGFGSPNKADSHDAHGAPLGADEAEATRKQLGWNYGEFEVPEQVYDTFRKHAKAGSEKQAAWNKMWKEYQEKEPELAAQFKRAVMDRKLPDNWTDALPKVTPEDKGKATRLHSQESTIFVTTHDSIAVGEDGPTHQPIETLPSLRLIPDLTVMRPADGNETAGAYKYAVERSKNESRPTMMAFSRQAVDNLPNSSIENTLKGAYEVIECEKPELILIGTGSEVGLCVDAAKKLDKKAR
eukprot:g30266.t1